MLHRRLYIHLIAQSRHRRIQKRIKVHILQNRLDSALYCSLDPLCFFRRGAAGKQQNHRKKYHDRYLSTPTAICANSTNTGTAIPSRASLPQNSALRATDAASISLHT